MLEQPNRALKQELSKLRAILVTRGSNVTSSHTHTKTADTKHASDGPLHLTNRAAAAASSWREYSDLQSENDPVTTYHVLISRYRESRRLFAVPHLKLSRVHAIHYSPSATDTHLHYARGQELDQP
ncbi:hypothetical protein HPB50_015944 [Hyalomma asiaticum]|uniref:Uncharacterized protein n=1 Tax=Hyalomma asiaticum TaxID=266040 RepID=A0ACB7RWQ1_HYAAI|nr:hypothetical protein HPB50_015944 [Hyalomma asiaticum]